MQHSYLASSLTRLVAALLLAAPLSACGSLFGKEIARLVAAANPTLLLNKAELVLKK